VEGLILDQQQLLAALGRFQEALEEIAAFPCASDLPLCHNPGCAACRAARALAGPTADDKRSHPIGPADKPVL
jgi:hypothetical protein